MYSEKVIDYIYQGKKYAEHRQINSFFKMQNY